MKRVIHLITLLEFGGAQGNTIHTVKNLDKNIFEAHLWCGKGAFWDEETQKTIPTQIRFFPHLVRQIHPFFDVLIVFDLLRAFKQFAPDVVHTHSSKAGIVGRIAARWAKVPLVVHTFHGFGFNDHQNFLIRWIYVFLEKWTAAFAHKLIFVSEANVAIAKRYKIGNPSQYELIHSGVPIDQIEKRGNDSDKPSILHSLNLSEHLKIIVTISAFKPQKNLKDFISVCSDVLKQKPETAAVLIGDGEMRKELENQIQELGIKDRVRMPGWRKDAVEILAISDIFVLTSLWEGLPRALVEAMILGKPAVCYETDGVVDILKKGGGSLVPQKNRVMMTEQIIKILSDQNWASRLSSEAKTVISMDFDIDQMVRAQEKLYLKLL